MKKELIEVYGKITKVIFKKDDFMIGVLSTDTEQITFKGNMIGIEKGEEITLVGEWVTHPKYGQQLEVGRWQRPIPKTREKIIAYLSSPFVKGCGEKQAKRIVDKLGTDAIEIILEQKEQALTGIKGIGKKKAKWISDSIAESYELQNIIGELSEYGINPNIIVKLYEKYGSITADYIKENPYRLTELKYMSFPKADEIAQQMGISPLSGFRIRACVNYILRNHCYSFGHCFIKEDELIEHTMQLLNQNTDAENQVTIDEIKRSIIALEENSIVIKNGDVYPKELYTYEKKLAKKINYMLSTKPKKIRESKIDKAIKEYQLANGITLGEQQKEAVKTALNNNITVLTGSAGTGKTTVVKAIIEIYDKFFPTHEISLSAPTGRASKKLEESTGHFAQTNHRLLGYKQSDKNGQQAGFEYDEENKLPHDFFVIDEMSMVDLHMAYSLFMAVERDAKILLIGDVNQLPAIGAGNVLKDLLETEVIPKVRLTKIYRQAKNSQIIINANNVNAGKRVVVDHSRGDMYFINQQRDEGIFQMIIRSVLRFKELGYDTSDILVLSPMKKGIIGTIELNKKLQEVLNPKSVDKAEVKHGNRIFRVGDRVMQTVNQAEKGIYNGDIGTITYIGEMEVEIDDDTKAIKEVIVTDFQGNEVVHLREEWKELEHGYAITIHKSQGGQAPNVIIPMSTSHYVMLARNLLYTGMTRAEKILVIIGRQQALSQCISNNKTSQRNTKLKERIEALHKIRTGSFLRKMVNQ